MTDPDPYRELFDQIVAEWDRDEDALYRRFYPETNNTKETS